MLKDDWLKKINFLEEKLKILPSYIFFGRLIGINGLLLEVTGLQLPIGSVCFVECIKHNKTIKAECEVVSFKEKKLFLMSIKENVNLFFPGARVFSIKDINYSQCWKKKLPVGFQLLGRILDGNAVPLDGLPKLDNDSCHYDSVIGDTINPLKRRPINKVLDTGIRSINALLSVGKGQRIGLFSTSGIGKTTLLGMLTKYTKVDVIVIALIGERGREVKTFVEENVINVDNFERSVVIAAPTDFSPLLKIQGTLYATKIAEYFRKQKKHVLLIIDSLTRYAMALREIALSVGEIPTIKGYPPSVFSKLPVLVERAGNDVTGTGSITAFYTLLQEIDEQNDPISDMAKSILDGHIMLSRFRSERGNYPAIDIETSISRVMPNIITSEHYRKACYFKQLISSYQKNQDLINVGAYISGSDPILDKAIKFWSKLELFLNQEASEKINFQDSYRELEKLFNKIVI